MKQILILIETELALGLVIKLGLAALSLRLKGSETDSNLYIETGILR